MPNRFGQRWVGWATTVGVVALSVMSGIAPAVADTPDDRTGRIVRGFPRCDFDEEPNGWVWYEGAEQLGVTPTRYLTLDGRIYPAAATDCTGAAACLAAAPDAAGRVATLVGSVGADRLVGTAGRDLIIGRSGDDDIRGKGGRDIVCGGDGADIIRGGGGADVIEGGGGRDVVFGGSGADDIGGGSGLDVIYGQSGDDVISGDDGEDGCFGGGGTDILTECRVANHAAVRFGAPPYLEYEIEVEDGIAAVYERVIADVDRILADERSWIGDGTTGFRRVAVDGDFTIIVASPATVDALCAPLKTGGYLSCRNGNKVILNVNRWMGATEWWPATIEVYREYLVNHEVGHLLGNGHVSCPGAGQLAPVMMQQTKGLDGCIANGWVFP